MARNESGLTHEDAIAMYWLKTTERQLASGQKHMVSSLRNSFDSIVSDWEESGKLRSNHRPLDLDAAKRHAAAQLRTGAYPLTLRHFRAAGETRLASVEEGDDLDVHCDAWAQPELYRVTRRYKNGSLTLRSYCGHDCIRINDRTRREYRLAAATAATRLQAAATLRNRAHDAAIYGQHDLSLRLRRTAALIDPGSPPR